MMLKKNTRISWNRFVLWFIEPFYMRDAFSTLQVNSKIMDPDSDFKNFKNPSTTHEKYVHMVEKIIRISWASVFGFL